MGNILQLSIVVWSATFIFGPSEALGDAQLLLIPNFKLEARLKVIRQNSKTGLDGDLIVKESYSNVARRARLDLFQQDEQDSSLRSQVRYYYHDNSKQQMIKTNSLEGVQSAECLAADPKQLIDDLFGDLARSDKAVQAKDWLQVTDPVPSYVIGLARLLVLIKLNEDRYTLERDENPLIRNQRTIKFKLELSGGRKLAIYYAKLHPEPLEFPLRIWMSFAGGGEMIADFSNVDISPNLDALIRPAESDWLDQLSFPLGIGCAKHLAPAKLLSGGLIAPKVASFRASIKRRAQVPAGQDNPIKSTFVAYDGYVKMLRLDTMRNKQRADDEFNENSITIYDIVRHRKYNIKQQVSSGASRNKITVDRSAGSQCASSKMFTDGILNPFEPIIALDNISEMGVGMVRGVKSRIFEQVSLTLPPMLFPQVNYATVDGKMVSKFKPPDEEEQEEEEKEKKRQEYTITYYFAVPGGSVSGEQNAHDGDDDDDNNNNNLLKLGPLMRIDISRHQLVYRVEIEDFLWQLNEAPNGDRQDELFSLHDRCSSPTTGGPGGAGVENTNSYVQMALNLEYQPDGVETKRGQRSVAEVSRILESPITRNKALIRALCDASEQIVAKQIHDIESKIIVQGDKLTLKAGAKLSGQRLKLYEAKQIGTGLPEASIQTTGASDFDDCYWDAVHKRKQGQQLLFSYCFYLCFIDDKPQTDYKFNNRQGSIAGSQVFNPFEFNNNSNAYPCQVFKLEQQPDEIADRIATRSIYNKLRSTTIRFPLLDLFGGSKKAASLLFKVSQIDLGNEKWTASLRNSKGQLEPNRDYLLEGLALSANGARLVKAPALKGDKKQEQVADLAQMSLDMCHSSCMANISCNSFSVCANGQQLECLLSDLQFTDVSVFDQIKEKLAKLSYRQRTRLGSVLIDLPVVQTSELNDREQRQSIQPSKLTVELQVSNKCRIYNKYAIEMFRLAEKVSIKPPERYLIGADDEEQCAQSCLRANVKFFKRMAEIKLRWLSQSNNNNNDNNNNNNNNSKNNDDDDDDYVNALLEKQEMNLRYWCGSFKYLNLASSVEPYSLREAFASSPDKLSKNGLCLLSRVAGWNRKWANDNKTEDKQAAASDKNSNRMPRMMFHSYEFVYTMLYEKHFGIQLGTEIYLRGSRFEKFANKQLVSALSDAEHCARACFLQTSQLKPFCRSFALVTESEQGLTYCIFNSMSLWEVRQQVREIEGATGERVESPVSGPMREGVELWHFEPRSAYTLDELILAQLTGSSGGDDDDDSDRSGGSRAIAISCLGVLVVVAVSLISGLLMGATFANRLVSQNGRRESIENPSRSFLNSLTGSESGISHRRFVESDVDLPELDLNVGFKKYDN